MKLCFAIKLNIIYWKNVSENVFNGGGDEPHGTSDNF